MQICVHIFNGGYTKKDRISFVKWGNTFVFFGFGGLESEGL